MEAPLLTDAQNIAYFRHELFYEPEEAAGDLFTLVYDIPYFGACGVFPPLHIVNQVFARGGGDGGMSPGASWQPFSLSEKQYEDLLWEILHRSPDELEGKARYWRIPFIVDSSFDGYREKTAWSKAVCEKYRERWLEANREAYRKEDGADL